MAKRSIWPTAAGSALRRVSVSRPSSSSTMRCCSLMSLNWAIEISSRPRPSSQASEMSP
ncbi:MAG TPA: hypothetical protein VGJ45_17295 [Pseudonocardiaceae bacterium]